jgi:hypothetical protein
MLFGLIRQEIREIYSEQQVADWCPVAKIKHERSGPQVIQPRDYENQ